MPPRAPDSRSGSRCASRHGRPAAARRSRHWEVRSPPADRIRRRDREGGLGARAFTLQRSTRGAAGCRTARDGRTTAGATSLRAPRAEPDHAIAAIEPAACRPCPRPPSKHSAQVEPEAEPEAPPEALVDTGRSPPGAPKVALSFLQWSADPAKRFAFISVDGGAAQRVREGEVTSGMTVAAITPTGIQFKREGTTFVIRPRH